MILFRCFGKTRYEGNLDVSVPEFTADIARSGLAPDRKMVKVDRERYIALVKETLKFIRIPVFTQNKAK